MLASEVNGASRLRNLYFEIHVIASSAKILPSICYLFSITE
jgi:hypothetical protein